MSSLQRRSFSGIRGGLLLLYFGLCVGAHAAADYDPAMNGFRQLFADDYRVEMTTNVELCLHPGVKAPEPVLRPDQPWEMDATYLYGTVLFDEEAGLYKMWYQTFHPRLNDAYICYATSPDGQRWTKPSLGLVNWRGSAENNIVLKAEIGTVVKDDQTTDPARRYKMFGFIRPHYDAFFSPDGIHWTQTDREYVLKEGDVANVGWDPYNEDFFVLAKLPHKAGRVQFLSRSRDFEHWSTPTAVMIADDRDQALARLEGAKKMEIYGMAAAAYEGAYIGFPWLFRVTGKGAKDTGGDGHIDVQFAFSRDLVEWARPVRNAILPTGVAGSFDDEMIFTASAPVVRGDTVEMFYGAWDGPHGTFDRRAFVGRATWKRDRFVSFTNGGFTSGSIVTRSVTLDGESLMVNCDVSNGELRAELLDSSGKVLPGYSAAECVPLRGDHLAAKLQWRGASSADALKGQTVKIRFILDRGDLFSFWSR